MTMVDMNKYLESDGFKVDRQYDREAKEYIFNVEKNGVHKRFAFVYPTNVFVPERDRAQREFLEMVVRTFAEESTSCLTCRHLGDRSHCMSCFGHYDWEPNRVKINDTFAEYCKADVVNTMKLYAQQNPFAISKVIFNPPATIVMWADGEKTVVKAQNEAFDPEKGLAMAIAKKALGNKGNYFEEIKKWVGEYDCEKKLDLETAWIEEFTKAFGVPANYLETIDKE